MRRGPPSASSSTMAPSRSLGSERAFSTAEYFRMSQSDPYPDDYKSEIINEMMTEWTEEKPPPWFEEANRLEGNEYLRHLRVPLPPTIDTEFVAKTRGPNTLRGIATLNEAQGPWAVHEYYKGHPDVCRHIPAPVVYATTSTEPSLRTIPGAFAMSYLPGLENYPQKFPGNCRRWTRQQRRRFVRQMALMRLQLLEIRWNRIGGRQRHISPAIHSRVDHFLRDPRNFVKRLGPWRDARSWVEGSLFRELRYWESTPEDPDETEEEAAVLDATCDSIEKLLDGLAGETDRFRKDEVFCLTHNKLLPRHRSILMEGKRIGGLVDWEHNTYEPLSESVSDLFAQHSNRSLANPDEWNDHPGQNPPFTESMLRGVRWDGLIEIMQKDWDQRLSHISYQMYGTITESDYLYGDRYVDQPIPEDDIETLGGGSDAGANEGAGGGGGGGGGDDPPEPQDWWIGPVFHLMDDYLVKVKKYPRTWKWQDPMVLEWAQTLIHLGKKCEVGI